MILLPLKPHTMSRKPTKGYYVKGHFVAEGSELDLELKRELKGSDTASKTDLKRESDALQKLGEDLLLLRMPAMQQLVAQAQVPEALNEAIAEAKKITNFEGKRRQMQYVGKLMRKLDESQVQAIRAALDVQHNGSAEETLALHMAEHWRDRLLQDDSALADWLNAHPDTDANPHHPCAVTECSDSGANRSANLGRPDTSSQPCSQPCLEPSGNHKHRICTTGHFDSSTGRSSG